MKDVNLGEDTIQKTEILMNSARLYFFIPVLWIGGLISSPLLAQSGDLIGPVTVQEIAEHDRIYDIYMERYQPSEAALEYLATQKDSIKLIIFLGDWCKESKKYLPGLMKTLGLVDSGFIRTEYIGVDPQKKIPKSFLKMYEIKYIPTVVVLKGNVELGRIEEKPHELIETDLVQILKKAVTKK
ncbi:MAG: hypothetical protein WD022_03575 [Balneolaceae bacterium]